MSSRAGGTPQGHVCVVVGGRVREPSLHFLAHDRTLIDHGFHFTILAPTTAHSQTLDISETAYAGVLPGGSLIILCFRPQPNASDLIPCCPHPFPRQLKQPVTQFGAVRLCCHSSAVLSKVFEVLGR